MFKHSILSAYITFEPKNFLKVNIKKRIYSYMQFLILKKFMYDINKNNICIIFFINMCIFSNIYKISF